MRISKCSSKALTNGTLPTQLSKRKAKIRILGRTSRQAIQTSHRPSTPRSSSYSTSRPCCTTRQSCRPTKRCRSKRTPLSSLQASLSKRVQSRQLTETMEPLKPSISASLPATLPPKIIACLTTSVLAVVALLPSSLAQLAISLTLRWGRLVTKIKAQS